MAVAIALLPVSSASASGGYLTSDDPFITLSVPGKVRAIISSGDQLGGFLFEGLPDGVGIRPGSAKHTVDVYVAHENTTVPFFGSRDFQGASVSRLTLTTKGGPDQAAVLDASVALSPNDGFLRFCSASMAGPSEGLDDFVFFTGEETNDVVNGVQRGYAVVLNTRTGQSTAVPGMGRLNHENTVVIPGGWDDLTMLTTDDTFSAPSSQLYMYRAADQDAIFADEGTLYAFRVTGVDGVPLGSSSDPFNGANDYLDLNIGETFQGEFIPVPANVATGDQNALEAWSNENNVFQAIRLEDLAADEANPRVVYIADTGATRVVPNATNGRMMRGPSGTMGQADNGRIFRLVLNADDPTVVDSLTILADGDAVGTEVYVPFTSPDNVAVSKKSLMVQEDTDGAQIFQYRFEDGTWRSVATVNDLDGESTGIVDASAWFGGGTWLVNVQGHGANVAEDTTTIPGVLIKRESGQLMLMTIPGS
jgi:hypothetical protein